DLSAHRGCLTARIHHGIGDRSQALTPPGQPEPVCGRAGDGHGCADRGGQHLSGLEASGADLRAVPDDLDGDVADLETGLAHDPGRLGEQVRPRGTGELRTVDAEVLTEV